jgi:hypothetical protein
MIIKLKIKDFSTSTTTTTSWEKEAYFKKGINIGIYFFDEDGDMYDGDIMDNFPIIDGLKLGTIVMDEGGFLGINSQLTIDDIKNILNRNGFRVHYN